MSALQRVAACCSVLQRVAACCSVLQRVAACCSALHCVSAFHQSVCTPSRYCVCVCCSVLQRGAISSIKVSVCSHGAVCVHIGGVLQCVAVCCRMVQFIAACCRVLHRRVAACRSESSIKVSVCSHFVCVCVRVCACVCVRVCVCVR